MKIKVTNWKISTLLSKWDKINEQPEYQRGGVWSPEKESLLIDSILRGLDIPKIYLRKVNNSIHEWEVADGQQRITAIVNFYNGDRRLSNKKNKGLNVGVIENEKVGGLRFNELPNKLKDVFLNTVLTISSVDECTEDEIRILFGRLQEGIKLNAAEKRNSIISGVGKIIDSFVLNHIFFDKTKISKRRFKHQDYLTKAIALIVYENKVDLKGAVLEQMYLDSSINLTEHQLKKIDKVLDFMHEIDLRLSKKIKNEFTFIDIFWFLYENLNNFKDINFTGFVAELTNFEKDRLFHRKEKSRMDSLLLDNNEESKKLYDYILAYDRSGSNKENIQTRNHVFKNRFKKYLI